MLIELLCTVALAVADGPLTLTHDEADALAAQNWVDMHLPELVATYQDIHAHPELSGQEARTAGLVAARLRQAGYAVTAGVGGHGVVGVLANGQGPTVLVRGDMDALPIVEQTGLPYASTVVVDHGGQQVGVMHACGHDIHTTALIGTGQFLATHKSAWSGTLVLVAQPAEEIGQGAQRMIADGLFERFPRPDYCVSLHVKHDMPAGTIGWASGWAFANVDSVDVTLFGPGGHGARPHEAADPVVAAAHLVSALQTLVSRRIDPTEQAVVTVGSIHGGTKHNIIASEVTLQLTVRSYSDAVRTQLLAGIRQLAIDTARTFQCPREPHVIVRDEHTPSSYNDPELGAVAAAMFERVYGAEHVVRISAEMIGEDFGCYARHLGVPGFMFRVGAVSKAACETSLVTGVRLPGLHTSRFAPVADRTLDTSITAISNLVLGLMD